MINPKNSDAPQLMKTVAIGLLLLSVATTSVQAQALILSQSSRTTIDEAAQALKGMLEAQGVATEIRVPMPGEDPGNLDFQCVWDLRIDRELEMGEVTRLTDYAMSGGSMFFSGEHATFGTRNFSVAAFLTSLGGGGVLPDSTNPPIGTPTDLIEVINPGHIISVQPTVVNEVVYDGVANGYLLDVGTGAWLSREPLPPNRIGSAVYDPGTLFLAPDAKAIFVMDINFLSDGISGTLDWRVTDRTIPTENRQLVNNMIDYLCLDCQLPTCCQTWDDLKSVIADADIDREGVRNSFDVKANSACRAYERQQDKTSANVLCAVLHEADAQDGKHVSNDSADDIRECVRSLADNLDLTLRCDQK